MPTSSYQVGDGITAETRKRTTLDEFTLDDMHDIAQALLDMPERLNRPWGTKAPLIRALRKRLVKIKANAPAPADHDALAAYFATRKTEAWYVVTAVKIASHVEKCIETGRVWEAVSFAFEVGELVTEVGFKLDWEQSALAGQKLLESQGQGARARRKRPAEERHQPVLSFLDKGNSLNRSLVLAARQLGDSPGTIRRNYYNIKNRSKPARLE